MRWGLLLVAPIVLLAACGGGEAGSLPPTATLTVQTPEATPSPGPDPTAAISEGVWVQTDIAEGCLEVRVGRLPGSSGNCLPDGFVGLIIDGPDDYGGQAWWMLAGQGWLPEKNLRFHHEGGLPYPPRPDLSGAGLIAYRGVDRDIWIINADGSQARRLIDIEAALGPGAHAGGIVWSPTGDAMAVPGYRWLSTGSSEKETVTRTHSVLVADLTGAVLATIPDALLPSWSPDGTKLALLAEWSDDPEVEPVCAFRNSARIGVFDLLSGQITPLTPRGCYFDGPVWSPDGAALLYARDGDIYHYVFSEGMERTVRTHGEDDWYFTVTWAPDSSRFSAFHQLPATDTSLGAYDVVELGSEEPIVSFPEPRGGCGRGASAGDWRTLWTADGHNLLYHEQCGEPGFSGVWIGDVATGNATCIPVEGAGGVSLSPDGRHVVFHTFGYGSGNHLWVADIDGSNLTLLVEGGSPAWQPLPAFK